MLDFRIGKAEKNSEVLVWKYHRTVAEKSLVEVANLTKQTYKQIWLTIAVAWWWSTCRMLYVL